ncbi:MAG: hypothetical protein LBE55_02770 [Clostridiales bacterium]|jgi:hypothetical protein|nr:hypothetical protein [Clostridiales bacterium]
MSANLIYRIIDLILCNEVEEIEVIKKQRANLIIKDKEFFDNSKYITFTVEPDLKKISAANFSVMSIMFWEPGRHIPIDCILHFKDGSIHGLEVYSCDGSAFDDIDIEGIDIVHTFPETAC